MWKNQFINSAKSTMNNFKNQVNPKIMESAQSAKDAFSFLNELNNIGNDNTGFGRLKKISSLIAKIFAE